MTTAEERLALYESAQEIITTPSGRVWIAAQKHQAAIDKVVAELERTKADRDAWNRAFHAANAERLDLLAQLQGKP